MADRLTEFDFTPGRPRRPRPPYPLEDWLDGGIWRIWEGEDFEMERRRMRVHLHRWAGLRGVAVITRFVEDGDRRGIVFRSDRRWNGEYREH